MSNVLFQTIDQISREKGIDPQIVIHAIEDAIVVASRKHFKSNEELKGRINSETGEVDIFAVRKVVDDVTNPVREISLEEARQIKPEGADIQRKLSEALDGIAVHEAPLGVGNLADLFQRRYCASLIVGVHDADQGRLLPDRLAQGVDLHDPFCIDRQEDRLASALGQVLAGLQHCVMFAPAREDQSTFARMRAASQDSQIVRLRSAACEEEFPRFGADCVRDARACFLERLF